MRSQGLSNQVHPFHVIFQLLGCVAPAWVLLSLAGTRCTLGWLPLLPQSKHSWPLLPSYYCSLAALSIWSTLPRIFSRNPSYLLRSTWKTYFISEFISDAFLSENIYFISNSIKFLFLFTYDCHYTFVIIFDNFPSYYFLFKKYNASNFLYNILALPAFKK